MTGVTRQHIKHLLAQLDEWLCASEEETARAHGWDITRTGLGARQYRDPRFGTTTGKPITSDSAPSPKVG